ncbi:MAG: hypothetical protein Kow0092_30750 [Deferrisomatales bacterium]
MGLFLKPRISEREAAAIFLQSLARDLRQSWPDLAARLRSAFPSHPAVVDNESAAQREFSLAVVATHLEELHAVLGPAKAERVGRHVLDILADPHLGPDSRATVEAYRRAWRAAGETGRPPLEAVALRLYEVLGATFSGKGRKNRPEAPGDAGAVADLLRRFGVSWWRFLLQKYKIPDAYEPPERR